MEAAFQVVNQILTGYVWEQDALNRAKNGFLAAHEQTLKSLENVATEKLMEKVSHSLHCNRRFYSLQSSILPLFMRMEKVPRSMHCTSRSATIHSTMPLAIAV